MEHYLEDNTKNIPLFKLLIIMQHPSLFKGISTDDKMRGFNMLFLLEAIITIITGYSIISGSIFDVEILSFFITLGALLFIQYSECKSYYLKQKEYIQDIRKSLSPHNQNIILTELSSYQSNMPIDIYDSSITELNQYFLKLETLNLNDINNIFEIFTLFDNTTNHSVKEVDYNETKLNFRKLL